MKLINAVARFYPGEMITSQRGDITYGLITPKHCWLATQIYIDTFVTECLQMPSHGIDILKLIPDSEIDQYGMVTSEVVKMTKREIQQGARAAGLPFSGKNINPLLTSLTMLGFLEQEEDGGKQFWFKSPLIREPSTKIDWNVLMQSTQQFVRETWPEVSDEYNNKHCTEIELNNPFTDVKTVLEAGKPKETIPDKQDYGGWYEG